MKNIINRLLLLLVMAIVAFSCKEDDEFSDLVRDNRPAVPVTFPGATTFGFNPYIDKSLAALNAGEPITFTLAIPENSGRTIREITKVGAGATAINAGTLNSASYTEAPIAGSGTTATFTTTLDEFKTKRPTVPTTTVAAPGFRELAFIFLVTLDDDTQIVTQQVRVRIRP
ncbi:hypothetical protein Q0590_19870 [Rhodocytophaga aerolata]|uniref:DUF1735 domain-containing protein n=1 Tax=Rhodocytophaga aerolata TaxID=455078 RepID=A0ABT8R8Y7_9BACT|nr:hypothetical protein [Rhodocytophaga aerolata]MDO1448545.1 hypothetical protein [Rhodocytophaga aerolata]